MKNGHSKWKLVIYTLVVVVITAAVGVLGLRVAGYDIVNKDTVKKAAELNERYGKLYEIQKYAEDNCLWGKKRKFDMDEIYRQYLDGYGDPYTRYLDKKDLKDLDQSLNGTFVGTGMVFTKSGDKEFTVVEVLPDSPAEKAGIKAGDKVLKINGKTYSDSTEAAEAIRGKAGTEVELTYKTAGGETKTIKVVRGEVKASTVDYTMLTDKIGYIGVKSFGDDTGKEFEKALAAIKKSGATSFVLDLRNNPGGLFNQGLEVADQLLPEGLITMTKDRKGKEKKYNSDSKHTDMKFDVLVNQDTASAAEVVAAALKDNGIPIIGEKTFGKGIVQETLIFKDKTAAAITVLQYFSPKGNVIHKAGIEPDYQVAPGVISAGDIKEEPQLKKAMELLK